MLYLLAPVPGVHLKSIAETPNFDGHAVFGSDLHDFFSHLEEELGEGLPVLIWASRAGGKAHWYGPAASWRARYERWTVADGRGQFTGDPRLRPPSTITDTTFWLYWEVSDLAELRAEDRVLFSKLQLRKSKHPPKAPLRRAHLVEGPPIPNFAT